jgi:hypothetical protein
MVAVAAVVVSVAIGVGYVAGMAMMSLLNVVLPPFREEVDEDTVREFAPVALAYLTWTVMTVAVVLVALRRFPRES